MRAFVLLTGIVLAAVGLRPATLAGQAPPAGPLTVFLDCRAHGCDRAFFLTEIPYVTWTQDRLDAEVHLLITGLETGAGGSEYTVVTLGQRRFAARGDTLVTTVPPNSTDDARRREMARLIELALVPFALRSEAAPRLSLAYEAPAAPAGGDGARVVSDPWNNWVYRASAFGSGDSESRSSSYSIEGGLRAARITERWKLSTEFEYEYESSSFELDSGTVSFALRNWEFETVAIKSITQHWSVGAALQASGSQFDNQDLATYAQVAAEYNFFPWREATSRQFIAAVSIGARHFDYIETTIYERDAETRAVLRAGLAAESRQPWGSYSGSLAHARYLHDANLYSLELDANVDIRISRGLSLEFGVNAEKVNDQLYLPRGDASDDEVLTRQRALATDFRIGAYGGLSFTFGSIYNTIVNPRFDRF
jgi:hypothetical protein